MNEYLLIKLLHIVCFVYWLGGDLGTFYASRFVVRSDLSNESRSTALTIMMGCDQGPRFAMPLILPLGLHLAHITGLFAVPDAWLAVTWLLAAIWVTTVMVLHFAHGKSFIPALTQFDFYFRAVMIAGLLGLSSYALMTGNILKADWLATKLLIFALLVACGLMIRVGLKPFMTGWVKLMSGDTSDAVNQQIQQAIAKCRPYVYAIWGGLLICAALGTHLI
ncbi:hypothetical protein G8770_17215 [Aestuariicella hydrocarbonica]|uniref:Uncharacterized protein n=1 Tax=Pseudomaricurvus hydrocarbonicus TaxID=1470433 RepID=A0A9E5T1Z5_9GAMM|nr:hypothetical protein [Aestuariicella hydrocarbonica]NHO67291.1 hypothetical protein [Aestuariicella hydrocarbonica]